MSLSCESGIAQGGVVPLCGRSSQAVLVKLGVSQESAEAASRSDDG